VGAPVHPRAGLAAMIFQRVLKGLPEEAPPLPGLTDARAQQMVDGLGLLSSWWMNAPDGQISPMDVRDKLTEQALEDHLSDYDTVSQTTAFISTTAGTVEVNAAQQTYDQFPPKYTALRFATRNFTQTGYLVHVYVFVLGRKSIELEEFAEEVRDVNLYTKRYEWHHEGEIVAKINIPAQRIEKIERYSHQGLEDALDNGRIPAPDKTFKEPDVYRDPLTYVNLRGFPDLSP
jgi:hypothetical protein